MPDGDLSLTFTVPDELLPREFLVIGEPQDVEAVEAPEATAASPADPGRPV